MVLHRYHLPIVGLVWRKCRTWMWPNTNGLAWSGSIVYKTIKILLHDVCVSWLLGRLFFRYQKSENRLFSVWTYTVVYPLFLSAMVIVAFCNTFRIYCIFVLMEHRRWFLRIQTTGIWENATLTMTFMMFENPILVANMIFEDAQDYFQFSSTF